MYVAPDDQFEITQKRYRGYTPEFARRVWEKRRKPDNSPYIVGIVWTHEKKERIAEMLRRGLSSAQIGRAMNVDGGKIRNVVRHDPALREIGFARGFDK